MTNARFAPRSDGDVLELVDRNPLVWIFLQDDDGPFVTAVPARPGIVDGRLEKLVGHVPRGWRIAKCLESAREALILVLGPHAYISTSWMSNRTQAPTWNFASAQFVTQAELIDEPSFLEAHLRDLTASMERGRDQAWHIDEMGSRMQTLAARIVAFEARIVSIESRFKLGQDENDATFGEIVQVLERSAGTAGLLQWMRAFNPGRS